MSAEKYNSDLASRQIEINEWSYNNKMDTLFVFQILFMAILFICILVGLSNMGMVGTAFVWYSIAIVTLLVIMIIVNRSMYTEHRRDNRMWNRRTFDDDNKKLSPLGAGDVSYQKYMNDLKNTYGTKSDCECRT